MRLPDFLVIGAQKAGTTWLHKFLVSRPDVFVPKLRKELMYFDHKDRYESLGIEGYAAHFAEAGDAAAVGEVTPGYMWVDTPHPGGGRASDFRQGVPRRVERALGPRVKLVASLRNPVDRALSAFLHHREKGRVPESATIGDCWAVGGLVNIGFYGAHLAKWAEVFPRENVFLVTYDELFADPRKRRALLAFLGATPASGGAMVDRRYNKGPGFVRGDGAFALDGTRLATPGEIATLQDLYRPDVQRLAEEWRLDLRCWRSDFPIAERKTFFVRLRSSLHPDPRV